MNLTKNEIAVLTAIDSSEYGDSLQDTVWTFTIAQNSSLTPRSIPGIVASLLKKGLVHVGESDGEKTIGITDGGVAAYINAVGQANVKKAI